MRDDSIYEEYLREKVADSHRILQDAEKRLASAAASHDRYQRELASCVERQSTTTDALPEAGHAYLMAGEYSTMRVYVTRVDEAGEVYGHVLKESNLDPSQPFRWGSCELITLGPQRYTWERVNVGPVPPHIAGPIAGRWYNAIDKKTKQGQLVFVVLPPRESPGRRLVLCAHSKRHDQRYHFFLNLDNHHWEELNV